jgi:hypothetical protein
MEFGSFLELVSSGSTMVQSLVVDTNLYMEPLVRIFALAGSLREAGSRLLYTNLAV